MRSPQLVEFHALCEATAGRLLGDHNALHAFSVDNADQFWGALLTWSGLPRSGSDQPALLGEDVETARFFPHVSLNYAESLLRTLPDVPDEAPAVTAVHADRPDQHMTRAELRRAVVDTASALRSIGVQPGDRVSAVAPNGLDIIVGALAAAALGATVSTAVPDMGSPALLDRLAQTTPAVLLLDRGGMDAAGAASLVEGLPTVRAVCLLDDGPVPAGLPAAVHRLADLVGAVATDSTPVWEHFPFDHPLFVMFSSGTTGPPKAIVHGAGGTLLEHVKEHRLHGDLHSGDTLYFHTTTAWMMWNWQLSALAVGAHIVVNDAPVLGPDDLWSIVSRQQVTVFGTSPAYLQLCQDAGYRPAEHHDLHRVRTVLSTGAVLHAWQYEWLAEQLGPVPLQSISGGTDIIGCFLLGHPGRPVDPGRCQSISLGLDVAVLDSDGRPVLGEVGELVCRRPFPSRPVGFLRDPDGARFHAAYFAENLGVWTHGDRVELREDGSARVLGRSDGVMNVAGIRIGPAEVYTALREVPGIANAMAIEQRDPQRPGQTRMVLLVVPAPGVHLDEHLVREIRRTLRRRASAAHVPAVVVAVPEFPTTHSGKPSERAARDAVNGDHVANTAALRNPGSLAVIRSAVRVHNGAAGIPQGDPADMPPATTTDRSVTEVWADVLGLTECRPGDDFFDLGGDSRRLMTLVQRVSSLIGEPLSTVEFYRRPTLGTLLELTADTADPSDPLLRGGTTPPVFLISAVRRSPGAEHAVLDLSVDDAEAARYVLVPDLSDLDPTRPDDWLAEVAAHLARTVRNIQPTGPHHLTGWGRAGLLAIEIARHLRAGGEDPAPVLLVDAVAPPGNGLVELVRATRRWRARLTSPGRLGSVWDAFVDRYAPATRPTDRHADLQLERAWGRLAIRPFDGPVLVVGTTGGRDAVTTAEDWRTVAPRAAPRRSTGG
ncbi:acetoacetate--CoA ligase [Klenkia sp. PcliD-1-E]|uniref:acetoacetate--CoA ligase n=1 Tax=Klenkia sp. PcliD-1-E TaxID=2954492 RepID=UPI002096F228|nr:acetoacetate--CoA ligase [Klenkia sp. PcliD-1-E]MCO7221260.1 acetoacetate--CoA ligase [Klenkia sp. PcliD-1-E]